MASTTAQRRSRGAAPVGDADIAPGGGRLPRTQVGTTPQHLLMTLLGHYWFGRSELLPSAALVELLAEFDISTPSARAALNRLTKRKLLISAKRGRNTYYGLSASATPLIEQTLKRIVTFGARDGRPWDGVWTIVAFSVPEAQRDVRHSIRTNLHLLGFAALYDGLWCSPWDDRDGALAMLSDVGADWSTVMRAQIDARSTVQAMSAWDLDAVKQRYREFEEEFSPMLNDARRGALTASQALVARTKVMDGWRKLVLLEPDLPAELLPADWPRASIRDFFLELYESLAPVAKARCQQIIAAHSPELATLVTHPPLEPTA
jgi:phenylacetic acid degradation operon negative regulatory protein